MDLGADTTGPRGGVLDASIRQGILEALVSRSRELNGGTLEVFTGVRWWDNDFGVETDPVLLPGSPSVDVKQDWLDLVIGARWTKPLSDKWQFYLKADIGGFGLQSDFTSSNAIGFRYRINDLLDVNMQNKATWVDFETGTPGEPGYFAYDAFIPGPAIGLTFKF
jgi:hypothetical protein